MNFIELLLIAVALSMDAFAVAVCLGSNIRNKTLKGPLIIGLWFGVFQAVMPMIGFLVASLFAERIVSFDHWIAFGLLVFLGVKMIVESLREDDDDENETSLSPSKMLPYAVATSIDALAIGVSFAFLSIDILPAVAVIGLVTFLVVVIGARLGGLFGTRFGSKAGIAGGIVLILIGLKILLEHLEIIGF
ncbi:MAG: manganese efflux pump MntP family protein [Methanomassiliicoccaceae archaeon]|jgi:putative Mn2+ efflux pump MntP|nr:manganese efflux pump MntP family protein [Methanomassiliicoccaceae archaeon]